MDRPAFAELNASSFQSFGQLIVVALDQLLRQSLRWLVRFYYFEGIFLRQIIVCGLEVSEHLR